MDIITTARHFDLTPGLREHAEKRIERLQRYLGGVDDVHIIIANSLHRRLSEPEMRRMVGRKIHNAFYITQANENLPYFLDLLRFCL